MRAEAFAGMMVGAMDTSDGDVARADPVLRRRVLLILLAVVGIGVVAIQHLPIALHQIFRSAIDNPDDALRQAELLMLELFGPMTLLTLVAGICIFRASLRTLEARRFPPPGARVLRDTPVVRGHQARFIGFLTLAFGVGLVAASLALCGFGYRAAWQLQWGCPKAHRAA